ncbi:hypothetical protein ABW19_dt0205467 [Dactylella cylindrospora]|nr:hypothetical protein ABW19_dt0205467 [Dactylella cylindrospora]
MSVNLEERLAKLALETFDSLPQKCKPRSNPKNGVREWIPMSAVVLVKSNEQDALPPTLHLAALATGSKCLPTHHLPQSQGLILHDSHSEILSLRGLNRFLLTEAHHIIANPDYASPFLIRNRKCKSDLNRLANEDGDLGACNTTREPPFRLSPDVTIHLFSTEAPCGDASMEFIMDAQEDATPWPVPPSILQLSNLSISRSQHRTISSQAPPGSDPIPTLPGRSYFSTLSIVRRKPARPDAPLTLSKSCTDKLTLKQFTSVLSTISSLLISSEGAYISTFVVPGNKYNGEGYTRAFSRKGRVKAVTDITIGNYSFHPFEITPLPAGFEYTYEYSKPPLVDPKSSDFPKTKASNLSAVYISSSPFSRATAPATEVLISGVKQGNQQFSTSKDDRKGSVVCRKKMWRLVRDVVELLPQDDGLKEKVNMEFYGEVKTYSGIVYNGAESSNDIGDREQMKRRVVEALGGWERNRGDDDWGL